jgi:hypothetical protein
VPVRQWVLSFPIPLRSLFAVHPELLAPVLQIIHRVIATHLIRQAGVKRSEAATGAVTLIQRFGSAANLNIHLHALVLDGVYRTTSEGVTAFHPAPAPASHPFSRGAGAARQTACRDRADSRADGARGADGRARRALVQVGGLGGTRTLRSARLQGKPRGVSEFSRD